LAWNSQSSRLRLLTASMTGICHQVQFSSSATYHKNIHEDVVSARLQKAELFLTLHSLLQVACDCCSILIQ
jgi:hypothetical protein